MKKRQILNLAWPVMISALLSTTLVTIDMFWIGKLGKLEIASVSIAGSIMGIIYPLSLIVSAGTLALIARFKGKDDPVGIENVIIHSFLASFILSGLLFVVLYPLTSNIISVFKPEPALIAISSDYLRIMFIGLFFLIPFMVTNSMYYALGDTLTAMYMGIIANVINIILDPILIFGLLSFPQSGVKGAAIASVISNFIALVISIIILIKKDIISIELIKKVKLSTKWILRIVRVGIPASMQGITRPLTGTLLYRIVAIYGTSAIAAFGIGVNSLGLMFIYLNGFASATAILVGQSIGSGNHRDAVKAVRTSINLGFIIQIFFSIIYFVFATYIIRIFNSDPEVVRIGSNYLRIISPIILIVAVNMMFNSAFMGSGDTKPSMITSIISNWFVKLGIAALLTSVFCFKTMGIWIAIDISVAAEFIILYFWYRKKHWLKREI